jgi:putative transposase
MLGIAGGVISVFCDGIRWLLLALRSTSAVEAENLFLRRQLALYIERGVKPRRADSVTRIALTILSHFFDWRDSLVVVRPETLLRWHREGWKLFWRLKSRPGRPPIPPQLQALIRQLARENPLWGQERIANELRLKLGIEVSPRTVRKYLPHSRRGRPCGGPNWSTFLRTHARGLLACDFFVAVTANFRLLYVFVVIEHGTRRLLHWNVTRHPSAAWTLQQLREVAGLESRHRFLIHDRDSIFSAELDRSIGALGIRVLKSAPRCPRMNAVCERVIGTIRRECLDWLIPLSEAHLRAVLRSWVQHYNRGRPHMALGPGIPDPPLTPIARATSRHRRGESYMVRADPVPGGLHHEYTLAAA